jgi:hypothetical protein
VAALLGIEARSHVAHCGTRADVMEMGRAHPKEHPI